MNLKSGRPQPKLLLAWTALLSVAAWPVSAGESVCKIGYPAVKLLPASCQPVPAWCKRLAGHGARSWHQCRPSCNAGRLQFGDSAYPVSWSLDANKAAKLKLKNLFILAMTGWRQRLLTIWHGKVFSKTSSDRTWRIVYQVGEGLVALPVGSKAPKNCRSPTRTAADSVSKGKGHRLRGVHASCHGNACTLQLSLRRLLREVRRLRRHHKGVALRFVLAESSHNGKRGQSAQIRFVSGEIVLIDQKSRRRSHEGHAQREGDRNLDRARRKDSTSEKSANANQHRAHRRSRDGHQLNHEARRVDRNPRMDSTSGDSDQSNQRSARFRPERDWKAEDSRRSEGGDEPKPRHGDESQRRSQRRSKHPEPKRSDAAEPKIAGDEKLKTMFDFLRA